jgi:hypothetical protein
MFAQERHVTAGDIRRSYAESLLQHPSLPEILIAYIKQQHLFQVKVF